MHHAEFDGHSSVSPLLRQLADVNRIVNLSRISRSGSGLVLRGSSKARPAMLFNESKDVEPGEAYAASFGVAAASARPAFKSEAISSHVRAAASLRASSMWT